MIAPLLLVSLLPGLWLYSAYPYFYNNPYRYVNESLRNATYPNGANVSLPVLCLCGDGRSCGCDENQNQDYIKDLIGNGSYASLNKTLVNVADYNGTTHLILNGTLPNGTTAPGGTDDAATTLALGEYCGYWVMGLTVLYTVLLL